MTALTPTLTLPGQRIKLYNSDDALSCTLDPRNRYVAIRAVSCTGARNESPQSCISEGVPRSRRFQRNVRVAVGMRDRRRDYWTRSYEVRGSGRRSSQKVPE